MFCSWKQKCCVHMIRVVLLGSNSWLLLLIFILSHSNQHFFKEYFEPIWRCCWLLFSSALLVFCARGSSAMFSPNIIKRIMENLLPDISGWINGNLDCLGLQLSRETSTSIFLKYPIFSHKAWSHENNSLSHCLSQTNNSYRLLGAKQHKHEAFSICLDLF